MDLLINTFLFILKEKLVPKENPGSDINGCGSYSVNLDGIFNYFGAGNFTQCCNAHDGCYEVCNEKRKTCDDHFYSCLSGMCDGWAAEFNWPLSKKLCKLNYTTFFIC